VSRNPSGSVGVDATRLLGKWSLLAQRHLALGSGCAACSGFFGSVQARDLEQQMLDFLRERHGGKPAAAALLAECAGSVSELLKAIATLPKKAQGLEEIDVLLSDLRRGIESIEELHRS
jgi:hypothetical protein